MAGIARDLVFLKERIHAARESRDYLLLAAQHCREIEYDFACFNPVLRQFLFCFPKPLTGFKHCLAGNAADAQARAAECGLLLDASHIHAELRCANGRHITARPSTDNDQIMLHCCHYFEKQRSSPWGRADGICMPARQHCVRYQALCSTAFIFVHVSQLVQITLPLTGSISCPSFRLTHGEPTSRRTWSEGGG